MCRAITFTVRALKYVGLPFSLPLPCNISWCTVLCVPRLPSTYSLQSAPSPIIKARNSLTGCSFFAFPVQLWYITNTHNVVGNFANTLRFIIENLLTEGGKGIFCVSSKKYLGCNIFTASMKGVWKQNFDSSFSLGSTKFWATALGNGEVFGFYKQSMHSKIFQTCYLNLMLWLTLSSQLYLALNVQLLLNTGFYSTILLCERWIWDVLSILLPITLYMA